MDHLRNLELVKSESYLNIMEEGLGILNELDYPDALTGGLRRYADNARGIIERTRSVSYTHLTLPTMIGV